MFKRIIGFFMFFFCIVALVLYFSGVRHIDLFNSSQWLSSFNDKFLSMRNFRIPMIPEWNVDLPSNPAWYEYIAVGVSWLVNFFTGLYNVIHSVLNIIIDLFKMMVALVWVFIDSPDILVSGLS